MGVPPRRRLGAPLKRETAAGIVRDMIADGTLLPGAPAPSGAELARKTGFSTLTCRQALRTLLADRTLTGGASPTARLRVAPAPGAGGTVRAAPQASLSRALAARRSAAGLTQPQLAIRIGVSVTTVTHAETGRLWQAREFWRRAGRELGDDGALLRMYDWYKAAEAGGHPELDGEAAGAEPEDVPLALPVLPASVTITPDGVLVVWPDGTETLATPPGLT
jgi:helix-turn-helix protein/regulatory GntR family protein